MNPTIPRIALLIAALGLGVLAWWNGLFERASDLGQIRDTLRELGGWAYVPYVLAFALLEPFGFPGIFFIVGAALTWPFALAFPLSLAGSVGAGIVGFGFARYLARDWVSRRLPARLRRHHETISRGGLRGVILIRLLFFLAPPAHWALGVSRIEFGTFVLGTAIGFVPWVAVLTAAGLPVLEWLSGPHFAIWIGVIAAALGLRWLIRRPTRPDTSTP